MHSTHANEAVEAERVVLEATDSLGKQKELAASIEDGAVKHAASWFIYHALSLVHSNLKEHAEHVYYAVLSEVKAVEAWEAWEAEGGKGGEKGGIVGGIKAEQDEEVNIKKLKDFARCN